jgi:hypothetical protein
MNIYSYVSKNINMPPLLLIKITVYMHIGQNKTFSFAKHA